MISDRLLNNRSSEYEYWTELERGGRVVAASERFHWDSTAYDNPRIDTTDPSGANVALDPRPPYPSIHHFDWLTKRN